MEKIPCPKCGTYHDVVEEWWRYEEGESIEEKCHCGYTIKYEYAYVPEFELSRDAYDELWEEEENENIHT